MSTLLKVAAILLSCLPRPAAQGIGSLIGALWFHVIRIRRRTVLENLAVALPSRNADHLRIAKAAYRHFGMTAVEFLLMSRLPPRAVADAVRVEGMEHFLEALSRNRGAIVVTAHLGNFDLLAASRAAGGIPLAVVSRTLHRSGPNRFWMESRKKSGLAVFEDRGASRQILRHLKENKAVALTVDQRTRPRRGGVWLPFFGKPALTPTAPAKLSAASGAPIVPVYIVREGFMQHRAFVLPLLEPPPRKDSEALLQTTKKINEIVEAWIRRFPEQYMWLHRRFVRPNDDSVLSRMQSHAKLLR